jgi:hypothetical protein
MKKWIKWWKSQYSGKYGIPWTGDWKFETKRIYYLTYDMLCAIFKK